MTIRQNTNRHFPVLYHRKMHRKKLPSSLQIPEHTLTYSLLTIPFRQIQQGFPGSDNVRIYTISMLRHNRLSRAAKFRDPPNESHHRLFLQDRSEHPALLFQNLLSIFHIHYILFPDRTD